MGKKMLGAGVFFFAGMLLATAPAFCQAGTNSPALSSKSLLFIHNNGQNADELKYIARASRFSLFLTTEEADVAFRPSPAVPVVAPRGKVIVVPVQENLIRMRFAEADPPSEIDGIPAEESDSRRSAMDAQSGAFGAVSYRGIYPGVDVVFRGDDQQIGFEIDLAPGADTSAMVLQLDGASRVTLDAAGNARIHLGQQTLLLEKPVAVAVRGNSRRPVSASYRIQPDGSLRFLINNPGLNPPLTAD